MVKLMSFEVLTRATFDIQDITDKCCEMVESSGIKDGIAIIMTSHTTTGITVNESLPCLHNDMEEALERALPIVEAIPTESNSYDFEARYEIGAAHFECPAALDEDAAATVERVALDAYHALGCSGFARVDLILAEDGPQILEINAIPGLTETSLLPQAAEAAGISFEAMVEQIIDLAE